MRHGRNALGGGLGQLVDEIHDARQLVDRIGNLVIRNIESGQHCKVPDLVFVK
jgi:hypothetical protein